MKIQLAAMIAVVFLLAGCTVNPADLAPKTGAKDSLLQGAAAGQNSAAGAGSSAVTQVLLDATEVAKHGTASDCWMIINGKVYDLTSYITHPGGEAYVPYCGKEATQAYDTKGGRGNPHSTRADALLPNFEVGALGQTITLSAPASGTIAGGAAAQQGANSTGSSGTGRGNYGEYED